MVVELLAEIVGNIPDVHLCGRGEFLENPERAN